MEEIKALAFQPKHYAEICRWWDKHKWPAIPLQSLPVQSGFVAVQGEQLLAAVFVYFSNSDVCWMEWAVVNPDVPKPLRTIAIDLVIEKAALVASQVGFKHMVTSVNAERPFRKRLERLNFKLEDTGMVNMRRDI